MEFALGFLSGNWSRIKSLCFLALLCFSSLFWLTSPVLNVPDEKGVLCVCRNFLSGMVSLDHSDSLKVWVAVKIEKDLIWQKHWIPFDYTEKGAPSNSNKTYLVSSCGSSMLLYTIFNLLSLLRNRKILDRLEQQMKQVKDSMKYIPHYLTDT